MAGDAGAKGLCIGIVRETRHEIQLAGCEPVGPLAGINVPLADNWVSPAGQNGPATACKGKCPHSGTCGVEVSSRPVGVQVKQHDPIFERRDSEMAIVRCRSQCDQRTGGYRIFADHCTVAVDLAELSIAACSKKTAVRNRRERIYWRWHG